MAIAHCCFFTSIISLLGKRVTQGRIDISWFQSCYFQFLLCPEERKIYSKQCDFYFVGAVTRIDPSKLSYHHFYPCVDGMVPRLKVFQETLNGVRDLLCLFYNRFFYRPVPKL